MFSFNRNVQPHVVLVCIEKQEEEETRLPDTFRFLERQGLRIHACMQACITPPAGSESI